MSIPAFSYTQSGMLTFAPPHTPPAKPEAKAGKGKTSPPPAQPAAQLQSAVQVGNVSLTQETPAKPADATAHAGVGAPDVTTPSPSERPMTLPARWCSCPETLAFATPAEN